MTTIAPEYLINERASSPAEHLAARCGHDVTRLEGSWKSLLKEMPKLGVIRCHTGNRAIVNNRVGPYRWVRFIMSAGQTWGPEVDLRLFMKQWIFGFAVEEDCDEGTRRSLQFFDKYGDPIHKVFLLPESNVEAYRQIVAKYRSADQRPFLPVEERRKRVEKPDSEVDVAAFQAKWRKMWDTHQFFSLHKKFGLSRLQAMRLAPPELVTPLPRDVARHLFEEAARQNVKFMTFSGNRGCLQIHNGVARRFQYDGEFFFVREDDFHLDIHEPSIAHAFEVKKPTLFGNVTSIELFDAEGENVAVFYGERGRLERERADWRRVLRELPRAK